jgi:exosortase H (IPTLxxWG-CTERM-specific)
MSAFLLRFLLLLAALFALELTPWAQTWLVGPWTSTLARIAAGIVTLFDPNVVASGNVLRDAGSGFAVAIEAGCNGVEATLVLVAAMVAYPASLRAKLVGLALGIVAVQGLNVVRVVSLFYLGQWSRDVFEWAHLYVWQALIMLDVLIVWLVWIRRLARDKTALPPGPPPAFATA